MAHAGLDTPPLAAARPDVLAWPSPTISRYLVFVTALLSSGLFVGGWVHNQTVGQEWARTYLDCQARHGTASTTFSDESYAAQQAVVDCAADVERTRALMTLAGAGVAALLGLCIVVVAPLVIQRRRRLRALSTPLQGAEDQFRLLVDEAGLTVRVRPMVGRATQRDAFSIGWPGRYTVALPPAVVVRWRDRSLFDPVVSHELAHLRHGDVTLAWLTRSVWIALAPLLLVPAVVGLATWDLSLLPGYAWRAALLAVVVALVSATLLRSREYDADLLAARLRGGPAAMERVLGSTATRRPGSHRVALLANHPTSEQRLLVLHRPSSVTRATFVDGLTAAFLAGLSLPLVVAAASPVASRLGDSNAAYLVAACLLGPLLAGSVGLGAWRDALVRRLLGETGRSLEQAAGVGVGLVLGSAASLQNSAAGLSGLGNPAWLLVIGAAGAGVTVLSAALGELWADVAPRIRRARTAWLVALAVNAALFTATLWAAALFVFSVDNGGWAFARQGLVWNLSTRPIAVMVVALAGLAAFALVVGRRPAPLAPSWLVEGSSPVAWPTVARVRPAVVVVGGLAAGLAGVAVMIAFRLVEGAAGTDEEIFGRVLLFEWYAGAVAAACVLALALVRPGWGGAAGLVAAVASAAMTTAGFVTVNAVSGNPFHAEQLWLFVVPALCLALFLSAVLLPAVALLAGLVRRELSGPAAVGLLVAAPLVVAALVLPGRTFLVGTNPLDPLAEVAAPETSLSAEATRGELSRYLEETAAHIESSFRSIDRRQTKLLENDRLTPDVHVQRLREDVLVPLRDLVDEVDDLDPGSDGLDQAHGEALEALTAAVAKVELIIDYYAQGDPALIDQAVEQRDESVRHFDEWHRMLGELVDAS